MVFIQVKRLNNGSCSFFILIHRQRNWSWSRLFFDFVHEKKTDIKKKKKKHETCGTKCNKNEFTNENMSDGSLLLSNIFIHFLLRNPFHSF